MDKNLISLNFNAKIVPFEKINDQFTWCKCYIHALGKNRNFSHFSKENVNRNLDTIYNIPVVAHIRETEDGFKYVGSHDMAIELQDGKISFKDLTVPFGVLPFQGEDTLYFEDVTERDGSTVTYLVGNIILWSGRYPELMELVYDDQVYFNQSMEINYSKIAPLEEDKNYTDVIDYVYSALCLLGKSDESEYDSEPCFPSSRVEPTKFELNTEFLKLMGELKKELAFCFKDNQKGEKDLLFSEETRDLILAEYGVSLEDLQFEITETTTEEDFRKAVKDFATIKSYKNTFATVNQKREALRNTLDDEVIRDDEGDIVKYTSYWVVDFDDNYVFVNKYSYSDDNQEEEYGRFNYVFDNESMNATITSDFEKMIMTALTLEEHQLIEHRRELDKTEFDNLTSEFESYKTSHSFDNDHVKELEAFKVSVLNEAHKANIDSVVEEFDDVVATEEFIAIGEKIYEYEDIEQLREKLFSIRGRYGTKPEKTTKQTKGIKVPYSKYSNDTQNEPYNGLFKKFNF